MKRDIQIAENSSEIEEPKLEEKSDHIENVQKSFSENFREKNEEPIQEEKLENVAPVETKEEEKEPKSEDPPRLKIKSEDKIQMI